MISAGVVPILIGPLQILLVILGGAVVAFGGLFLALFRPAGARKALRILWRQKIPIVVAVVLVWAAAFGLPQLHRGGGGKAAVPGFVECPMLRGGPDRRGYLASETAAPDPMLGEWNWAFAQEARTFYSSPAVDGRYVYVASAEKKVFSDTGNIFCLDAATGEVVWRDNLKGYRATFSSPAVAGDAVVCGEGLHYTADARIVCLDRRTGEVRWEHRTASHVESSPCIYNGKVYVGAGDDGIYCLDLEPESPPAAKIVWHKPGAEYPDAESAPAALDGKVYIGLGLGGRAVCCLDAETGDEIWRTPTPYPVWSAPSVVAGRLYVGMGNGNFVESAEEVWAATLKEMRSRN
ncbi:MAG: PQQ-binding-like beta-propeller repeat protein, partial [Candidatus Sumerlaeia bacterium]|nr:PQQ-binding-like beta-propeller repeat protein [Candidatus Sumerlaeia bacterium]